MNRTVENCVFDLDHPAVIKGIIKVCMFVFQKSTREVVEVEHGHKILFFPKFHCELNFIEIYINRKLRQECKFSFDVLKVRTYSFGYSYSHSFCTKSGKALPQIYGRISRRCEGPNIGLRYEEIQRPSNDTI
jgi:hypothetical protein